MTKPSSKHGTFSEPPPTTLWITEKDAPDCYMELLQDFSFTDPDGKTWITPAGYEFEGASIPKPLWTLVGSPFTGDYRRAAVVHDKACEDADLDPNPAQARRLADRMFYHACRAGDCKPFEALLLYIGVRIGAHLPLVAVWKTTVRPVCSPRLARPASEERLEADFRLIADLSMRDGETDDIDVIERRVDAALEQASGQAPL